jgi:hypothetical protein
VTIRKEPRMRFLWVFVIMTFGNPAAIPGDASAGAAVQVFEIDVRALVGII